MNWVRRIRFLLGAFWYRMFDDQDFLLGVEYLLSDIFKHVGYTMDNWVAGMLPMIPMVYPARMPFVVYLDVSSLHKEWYGWEYFIEHMDVEQMKKGPTDPLYTGSSDSEGKGWVVNVVDPIPEPWLLMDHVYKFNRTLTNGPDFKFSGNQILFYVDPTTLNLPSVKVTTKTGELKIYWKLIGVMEPTYNEYDAVAGFMSPELNSCADIVWDIHQNGATYYNTKKLLASVTDNVICDADGAISEEWSEQGWNFIRVDNRIYKSQKPFKNEFRAGADVKKGDILFGDMQFYKGSDNPDADKIPGVRVRTDAGELIAENSTHNVVMQDDVKILPLTGTPQVLMDYVDVCVKNSKDPKCPYIDIDPENTGTINPYKFVMQTLRRGKTCAVRLTAVSVAKLEAAIQVLRKSASLGGLITLYVKDSSDTANVTVSGFTADAGMGVVAVDATVTIQGQAAEARILP